MSVTGKKTVGRDDLDRFFDYDINIPLRTIFMGSVGTDWEGDETGVDHLMAERVMKALILLDSTITDKDTDPITIIMNNPGGDWYHGMAIFDAISTCKNHITIKVFGHAMSMGSVILQASDHRVMSKHSTLMLHYGTNGTYGHSLNMDKAAEENKRINTLMEDIYLSRIKEKHPKFRRQKLKDMIKFDKYLTAQEALDLGLIDEIMGED